jgi:hypothetical protein
MLGPVFSIPRDVTFGHSRQWRTMKGPSVCSADMESKLGTAETSHKQPRVVGSSELTSLSRCEANCDGFRLCIGCCMTTAGCGDALSWGVQGQSGDEGEAMPSFPLAKNVPSDANGFARIGRSGKKHYECRLSDYAGLGPLQLQARTSSQPPDRAICDRGMPDSIQSPHFTVSSLLRQAAIP